MVEFFSKTVIERFFDKGNAFEQKVFYAQEFYL